MTWVDEAWTGVEALLSKVNAVDYGAHDTGKAGRTAREGIRRIVLSLMSAANENLTLRGMLVEMGVENARLKADLVAAQTVRADATFDREEEK